MVKPARYISEIEPYKITPQDVWAPISSGDIMKLDWNESPIDFSFYVNEIARISKNRGMIAWYPDYKSIELNQEISKYVCIDKDNILTFPGSDVALELICRAYLESGDRVVAVCPTYENFFIFALQTGSKLDKLHLPPPYRFNLQQLIEKINSGDQVKLVYITRPNNPCGYLIDLVSIESLAIQFPQTMFVIDEAYIEFSYQPSCVSLIPKLENLIVTRTFSKAFGLAGLRLGYVCASLETIEIINKIRNGKNISMISQKLGLYALRNIDLINQWILEVTEARSIFTQWCDNNGITYFPSYGNFVLFLVQKPLHVCNLLREKGIFLRDRNSMITGGIRATMGNKRHVAKLIQNLELIRDFI